MKAWKLLFALPVVGALAMVPQQGVEDPATIATVSALQYVNLQGTMTTISARDVVEIRLLDDQGDHVRFEVVYDNRDYSLITAQAMHILRSGSGTREVKLVHSKSDRMRFPRLP